MIFWYELRKLVFAPAFIGFVLLCLIVNAGIVFTGYQTSAHLEEGNTKGMNDIFDDYDTKILSQRYIARLGVTGEHGENIREKYERLQSVVDLKGAEDESLSPYFGENTRSMHKLLFQGLLGAVALEGSLIALFASLLSCGYERSRNTEGILYATKTGRRVQRTKLLAALTTAGICFLCLLGTSLLLYFLRFDYSGVWNDSVSSLFNSSISDYAKPFITWRSFTVLQLLIAYSAVSAGLVVCFTWLSFAAGTLIRNVYRAVGATVSVCVLMFVAEPIAPYGSQIRNLLNMTPVGLLHNAGDWFTDGYADVLWPHFECWGVLLSFAAFAVLSGIATWYFDRRDLT